MFPQQWLWWILYLLKVKRRFGSTCSLHLQGRRISQARNLHKQAAGKVGTLFYLSFGSKDGGHMFLRNYGWPSTIYSRRQNSAKHHSLPRSQYILRLCLSNFVQFSNRFGCTYIEGDELRVGVQNAMSIYKFVRAKYSEITTSRVIGFEVLKFTLRWLFIVHFDTA
jgi:hypothetical protein